MHKKAAPARAAGCLFAPFLWSRLRGRMTMSYMFVTAGSVLMFIGLVTSISWYRSSTESVSNTFLATIKYQAQEYALIAETQSKGEQLNPQSNFEANNTASLIPASQLDELSYVAVTSHIKGFADPKEVRFALLVDSSGHVLSSSYLAHYPAHMSISQLVPGQQQAINQALQGGEPDTVMTLDNYNVAYAALPVMSRDDRVIGAIYLQVPVTDLPGFWRVMLGLLEISLLCLILITPVGVFFGWLTTRGLVRRIQRLITATEHFARGDYARQVETRQKDEIGQLEQGFNQMAGQVVENIARSQQFASQNARLQERARISRELHDAISQDLFSLRMLADGLQVATQAGSSGEELCTQIGMLEKTTANMMREMRALLLELRPLQLENCGLHEALRELAHVYSTRLGITVTADLKPVKLDIAGEHALLRIAQEALTNAARHGCATIISLSLAPIGRMARLVISDNGKGFENQGERHGLGLMLMRERTEELQGKFVLQSSPGEGTIISIVVPLMKCEDEMSAANVVTEFIPVVSSHANGHR